MSFSPYCVVAAVSLPLKSKYGKKFIHGFNQVNIVKILVELFIK